MTSTPTRPDNTPAIVGGLLGGLAVAASVIAYFTFNDPRARTTDDSVQELRVAIAELRVQTAELRAQLASQPPPQVVFQAPPPTFPPPAPPEPPAPPLAEPLPPPPPNAVECSSTNRCTLDRGYAREILGNPAGLTRMIRIVPSVKDGEIRGIKLFGIRAGSLPSMLGFKNGDLVRTINGAAVTNPEAALRAHADIIQADTINVEIERKGEVMTMTCDLR